MEAKIVLYVVGYADIRVFILCVTVRHSCFKLMHSIQEVTNVCVRGTTVVESAFDGSEQFPLATLVVDNGINVHHPFVTRRRRVSRVQPSTT